MFYQLPKQRLKAQLSGIGGTTAEEGDIETLCVLTKKGLE